jgi:hypothetical protein
MAYTDARMKNLTFRRCYPDGDDEAGLCPVDPRNAEYVTMRKMVTKQFTPGAMRRLRPRIELIVNELVDAALDARDVDLVEAFGFPPVMASSRHDRRRQAHYAWWATGMERTVCHNGHGSG